MRQPQERTDCRRASHRWCWRSTDAWPVCNNYATHKSPAIRRRLEQHPRYQVHHTPTYSSQINQVKRSFAYLTDDLLRRTDHRSVQALEKHIRSWVAE